ncbi:16S rRNA (cytidine(1402)-2'-O)-methyltransferase [Paenibacillus sp. CGMCC 1.16610]|uniref:Ribosomal RNA small subunit methyltransferase I n=1 Tax=Paenibacillus anseongense TaxID=2682845 RepID=A0ABW9UJL3_9BACL|nr:16S rRNA (cytidine(1402)-2'-O)-methyltransferase [Paenibacillus sp. CGMCC 1.16610]MBA2941017.1 16S rRNA (cytidine(1402)-2'-O)-methyltransferase [Paenibacillus sp. CGMCC 1.16610]MVQ38863.1 16S rRNA (cytidine(1402)-2'-O)-methyltransferase [Paenibacillus anseongense]
MGINVQKSYREDGNSSGTLYLVATPIGNLEDMTFRAIRILKEVNLIAAEDTRQTRKLLTHFEIATRIVSYHEHNKQASGPELVRLLLEGQSIALVSDAGLPAISDPGYDLVRMAVEQGAPVVPVPGANAALSALIASGLPTERFTFVGFLPREKKDQTKVLEGLQHVQDTLLFYESPHRVDKTLARMAEVWGPERRVCLARELTKRYEEFLRGTIAECLEHLAQHPPQGEYCVIAEGASAESAKEAADGWWEAMSLGEHVEHYEGQGSDRKEAMKQVASDRGLSKRDVYNALLER